MPPRGQNFASASDIRPWPGLGITVSEVSHWLWTYHRPWDTYNQRNR